MQRLTGVSYFSNSTVNEETKNEQKCWKVDNVRQYFEANGGRKGDIINHDRPIVLWTRCFSALSSANIMRRRHSLRLLAFYLPPLLSLLSILYCIHHRSTEKKTHTHTKQLPANEQAGGWWLAILGGSQTIKLSKSRFNFVFPLLSLPLGQPSKGGAVVGSGLWARGVKFSRILLKHRFR